MGDRHFVGHTSAKIGNSASSAPLQCEASLREALEEGDSQRIASLCAQLKTYQGQIAPGSDDFKRVQSLLTMAEAGPPGGGLSRTHSLQLERSKSHEIVGPKHDEGPMDLELPCVFKTLKGGQCSVKGARSRNEDCHGLREI